MNYLITPDDVMARQKAGQHVVIFDCRFDLKNPDWGKTVYAEAHIPGAFFLDLLTDLSDERGRHGGNHPFLEHSDFKTMMEGYGISDDTLVVAYDEGDLTGPSRLLYQGFYSGINNIRVLAGGLDGWIAAGGPTDNSVERLPGGGRLTIHPNESLVVDQAYVKEVKDQERTLLIDSRSYMRYIGKVEPVYPVAGHIPGAKNYFYADVVEKGTLKDEAFLKDHFKDVAGYDEIILSCGSGVSACVNSLALVSLGIPHKIYNGSYSEWIQNPENPVQQGEE